MSKAGEYTKTEKGDTVKYQTMTNRDFINRIYILRFEDCVESIKFKTYGQNEEFMDALLRLYWSFIMPRYHTLKAGDRDVFSPEKLNVQNGKQLLMDISKKMFQVGVNRPEKEQADLDHVAVDELEVVE